MTLPFVILVRLVTTLSVAGNLGGFAIAISRHFARPDGVPSGMRVIALVGYPFGLLHVCNHMMAHNWVLWRLVVGLLLCWISTWLFIESLRANRERPLSLAGSMDVPEHLNQIGPYARIRHPFYASYLYTWLGSALMGPWWLWIAPVVMGALYWHHSLSEEQKFLSSPLAAAYRAYMQHTGRFLPGFRLRSNTPQAS